MIGRFTVFGSCGGACCRKFHLPLSKEELADRAKRGLMANGSKDEYRKISEMVIPLGHGTFIENMEGWYTSIPENNRRYSSDEFYFFTCNKLNKATGLCNDYENRPEVCKIHPDHITINDGKYHILNTKILCPYKDCKLTVKEHPFDRAMKLFLYGLNGVREGRSLSKYTRPRLVRSLRYAMWCKLQSYYWRWKWKLLAKKSKAQKSDMLAGHL